MTASEQNRQMAALGRAVKKLTVALDQADAENADLRDELAALREKNEQQAVEIGLLRERVREVAEELSDSSVTFSDPRVSYEEIQLTAGWRKEWLSYPEVVRALEEKR